MTKRIFRSIFLVAFAVMLGCVVVIMSVLYGYFTNIQTAQLRVQTDLVSKAVSLEGMDYLDLLRAHNYRITWIDPGGTVKFDSDADHTAMDNHGSREEVQEALATGFGESSHYSQTMTVKMLYTAERLPDGTVIRMSVAQYTVFSFTVLMLPAILAMLLAAALLSGILAGRVSRKLVEPLNRLDPDNPLSNDTYEELAPLLGRIERQHRQISSQVQILQHKQEEFEVVTNNMSEGLALLNADGVILSINQAAARLLHAGINPVGLDMLRINRSLPLQALLQKAKDGDRADVTLELDGGAYHLVASPVITGGQVSGIVLLLFDITEKSRAEQLRREFTANVSHELKTPLHSISGCAEIIKNGLVKEADLPQFIEQIYAEAQRLIVLVDDIIRLSRLDEGAEDLPKEQVDLLACANATAQQLQAYTQENGVTLTVAGQVGIVSGVPRLLSELLYNLCDNAIKYNHPGGSVTVTVEPQAKSVGLRVQDTGIGIPKEHQGRIFERFYRVDKSHSKEIGGTGLGLSIVKHAALLHGGTIDVDSQPGKGTCITITFPQSQ